MGSSRMNRREFLKRMAIAGLAMPSTRLIFDMGKSLWRQPSPNFKMWLEHYIYYLNDNPNLAMPNLPIDRIVQSRVITP